MADEPLSWHFGLMSEYWAEFNTEAREAPFFLQQIARFGQPVLDLACGTGRVLLPLLRAGIEIDGCDLSKDMLEFCRSKAASEGYHPNLFNQPMHFFDLPGSYQTIYICDAFGLAGSRKNDLEALRRCHDHLEEGGALLVNIQAEYTERESWEGWLSEKRKGMPQAWPAAGERRQVSDGSELVVRFRLVDVNPLEQYYIRETHLEKWRDGNLLASESYALRENVYLKNELLLMLQVAGFSEVIVVGNYTDEPAAPEHADLVFIAIK